MPEKWGSVPMLEISDEARNNTSGIAKKGINNDNLSSILLISLSYIGVVYGHPPTLSIIICNACIFCSGEPRIYTNLYR